MNQYKVMLVDDHNLMRQGLVSVLDDDFEVVAQAANAREAMEALNNVNPDIILMDISMPDGSGIDLARKVAFKAPKAKIVLLSMMSMKPHAFNTVSSFISGYISKTTDVKTLNQSLRNVMNGEMIAPESKAGDKEDLMASLTPREQDILRELVMGHANKVIASNLDVAEGTIKVHIKTILKKLDVDNRTQAAILAYENGFGSSPSQMM